MATTKQAQDYADKISQIMAGYTAGGMLPNAPQAPPGLQEAFSLIQKMASQSGISGQIDDATFQRTIQQAQGLLGQNSNQIFGDLSSKGGVGPMAAGINQTDKSATDILTQLTGVNSSQYVNPQGGGGPYTPVAQPTSTSANPTGIDPNQPLSTPGTPVNQAIAPSDISQFIPGASTQQNDIVNNAIKQSQGVAGQNVQSLSDILGPYVQSQMKNWTDPNSADYQSTIGQLNNIGRADAGTFGQSLSSRLAPLIGQSMMELGVGALEPSFLNQQNLVGQGAQVQSNLGLDPLQRFIEEQNFNQQGDLAKQLASQGASAQFGSGIGGLLGGGLGAGAGALLAPTGYGAIGALIGSQLGSQGGSAAGGGGTWICTHLKKLKLTDEEQVARVHAKLLPAIFRHPIEWLHYIFNAPRLIIFCEEASLDWAPVKEILIDQVLAEPDPEKAWQIYRAECQRLCEQYAPQLWTLEATVCR